jgi:RNA polymerase sigma factor (sigma-70 family)
MDELIPTRATLIHRLKDWQDDSSWRDFFETYWKLIYDFARKEGLTPQESEDVVQETMIAVARNIPNFKYDPALGSFKGWLFNMTRWRISDMYRKRSPAVAVPMPPIEGEISDHPDAEFIRLTPDHRGNLEAVWNEEWEKNIYEAAVAIIRTRLDPKKFQIYDLYVNKDCPADQIAKNYNIDVEQIYTLKSRVTEMIKAEVRRLEKGPDVKPGSA